jgi:hypothetical protein
MDKKLLNEMLHEIDTMTNEAYWELFKDAQKLPDIIENNHFLDISENMFSIGVIGILEGGYYLSRNLNHYPIDVIKRSRDKILAFMHENEPITAWNGEKEHSEDGISQETITLASQLMEKHRKTAYERLEARRNSQKE